MGRQVKTGVKDSGFLQFLLTKHFIEQFHIPLGGFVPTEVLRHIPVLQLAEAFGVVLIKGKAALQCAQEIVSVVALEGEAKTTLTVIVHRGDGVSQSTGGMNHRDCTIAHGIHLAQSAGLGFGGHQVDVTAGIDSGGQTQIEGDFCGYPVWIFAGQLPEKVLKLRFASTQDQQLAVFFG